MVSNLVKILAKETLLAKLFLKLFDSFVGQEEGPDGENCCHDNAGYQVIVAENGPGRKHKTDCYASKAS